MTKQNKKWSDESKAKQSASMKALWRKRRAGKVNSVSSTIVQDCESIINAVNTLKSKVTSIVG